MNVSLSFSFRCVSKENRNSIDYCVYFHTIVYLFMTNLSREYDIFVKFIFDKEIGHQMAKVWIDENNFHVFCWEDFYVRFFF